MKVFLTTYQDNLPFALETKRILKETWNIDSYFIMGNKVDNDKYTKNRVVHWNWIEKILPICLFLGEDCIILEDDVRLTKSLDDLPFDEYDIIWAGFRRGRLEQKKQRITGIQAIYIKKEVLQDLYDNFCNYKNKIHVDHAMSKFCVEFMDKYKIYQPKLSYSYEEEHDSLISFDQWKQYTKPPK